MDGCTRRTILIVLSFVFPLSSLDGFGFKLVHPNQINPGQISSLANRNEAGMNLHLPHEERVNVGGWGSLLSNGGRWWWLRVKG